MARIFRVVGAFVATVLLGEVVLRVLLSPVPAAAQGRSAGGTALAAVAANFSTVAETLAPMFRDATGHDVTVTTGSTGKLFAQISAGAPFHVFLSADARTPARLVADGNAVAGTAFTYAVGRLALWSADPARIADGPGALSDPAVRFVAIANPELAPYGAAAREALRNLGLWERLQSRIVMGQNVGQTHALVATGAADMGFVALSALLAMPQEARGSRWTVPLALYRPIRQDAVLLRSGANNAGARAFLDFLRTPAAVAVIEAHGYTLAD